MPLAAWVTILAVLVVVAFVALALIRVVTNLDHVIWKLDDTIDVVSRIPSLTRVVPGVLTSVNNNLDPVRRASEQLGR